MSTGGPSTPPTPPPVDWFADEVSELAKVITNKPEDRALLSETRKEFQQALSLFNTQAQFVISIYLALFTLAGVAVGYALKELHEPWDRAVLLFPTGCLLLVGVWYSRTATGILRSSYKLYVASVVYATQLHLAAGAATHLWCRYVERHLSGLRDRRTKGDLKYDDSAEGLVDEWTYSDKGNLFQRYASLIRVFGALSFLGGVVLVFCGIGYGCTDLIPETTERFKEWRRRQISV